ncbi:putative bifunctional diguanylate cyclase/phosphodiesterase [Sulfurimonas diazotrophicus]|uniref:EAL domain-containing protein n=1 Tax=Sulfurimonas diazotrophicus TaxID=3131939 RepID=A0ABZ3H8T5_9BACT
MKGISLLHLSKHFDKADDFRRRLLRLLYDNLSGATVVIWFNASLFVYILWPVADHTQLAVWYALLTGVTLLRHLDTRRFFRQETPPYDTWYRRLFIGVLFSALIWGSVPLLFFTEVTPTYQMFIIIIIIGMSAGALSTLAADLRLSFIYLFGLLVPLAYRLLDEGSPIFVASFVLLLAFIAVVLHTAQEFHRSLVESYRTLELYQNTKDRLGKSEKRLQMMFDQTPIGIFYYDTDLFIIDANRALCNFLQAQREELIGLSLRDLPDQRPLQGAYRDGDYTRRALYEGPYHTKLRGLDLWIKVEFTPIVDDRGEMVGGMAMFTDKTQEHMAMKQAKFLSLHDPLTQLPNRELLKERIRQLLKEDRRLARFSALLFLDLDRFKHINDTAGHLVGDRLLIESAKRLDALLRESDTLSRLGGDEFVILLPLIATDEDGTVRHAFQVAEKIHEALRRPFHIEGHQLYTSCSIGVTTLESAPEDIDEVLRRADTAMYQAKAEGRDRTRFYDPEMDQKARDYLRTQRRLRHAIETGGFTLVYQPIAHITTDNVVAAEALLRWHDEIGNEIPPAHFIPVAEESGLIKAIGEWIINEACRQIGAWQKAGLFCLDYVSINISPRQLIEGDFADLVAENIRRHAIAPETLRLEITETALIENFDKTKRLIDTLNAQGIKFIIDDFGTGYSSLSYLKQFAFSALKIDQSFIRDILHDPKDATLVRAIIDIARQFDYQVIAEGVEEDAQREMLRENDDAIAYQGYLCSQAETAEAFEKHLHRKCG